MKKIVLLFICSLICNSLLAQVNNKAKTDAIYRNLNRAFASIDTISMPVLDKPMFFNQSLLYKLRLDSIQKTIPLAYNEYVQEYINIYSGRKEQFGKMLGLSNYYFPIFEKALKAYSIPDEIKYLPIIESNMNPHAISRVGATGMWQFMFATAKGYHLVMDNFVDERKDPIQASYAAAAYFRDAYAELGDWTLAIAAYNCGKGNVTRAIAKAGSRDFWAIRDYLPKETRNYVPAFIAAIYTMNYAKKHDIVAAESLFGHQTDTVQVNHFVGLTDLAKAINYNEEVLISLNPSFKKKIVNGTVDLPKRVILPKVDLNNYAALYDLISNDAQEGQKVVFVSADDVRELKKKSIATSDVRVHKVAKGENLSSIADKYVVEVQDLKVWNKLPKNTVVPGQKLKIYTKESDSKPSVAQTEFVSYKVKPGDTLSGIAEKFDASIASITQLSGQEIKSLQPGMVLKINKG
jgi:membrane-bound lytic murein transglycosylase D